MANPEHIGILEQGLDVWNAWRKENPNVRPNLYRANLRGADLRGADLEEVILNEADLRRAILKGANLKRANIHLDNLNNVDFSEVKGLETERGKNGRARDPVPHPSG